jgi:enoyl-CoA hydratase
VEQLMASAMEVAQRYKKLNPGAHKATKRKVRKALLDALDAGIAADRITGLGH